MTVNLIVLASVVVLTMGAGILLYRAGGRGRQAQTAQQDIQAIQNENIALQRMAQARVDAPRSRDELLAALERGDA